MPKDQMSTFGPYAFLVTTEKGDELMLQASHSNLSIKIGSETGLSAEDLGRLPEGLIQAWISDRKTEHNCKRGNRTGTVTGF